MSYRELAPAERRLMSAFLEAMQQGDTRTALETPAFQKKRHTLGEVLAEEAGGNQGQHLMACVVRAIQHGLKSPDAKTRLSVMAEVANLARLFADTHAEAGDIADTEATEEFKGDYADAMRLRDKDARAGVPVLLKALS
jgi:hypothetical protein